MHERGNDVAQFAHSDSKTTSSDIAVDPAVRTNRQPPSPRYDDYPPALMLPLIHTVKLNDVDPQAWFADVAGAHQRSRHPQASSVAAMELQA
jgi:hypothetical protein